MKNFREQRAYRLSLYTFLFTPIVLTLVFSDSILNNLMMDVIGTAVFFSPLVLIVVSLFLRLISLDISKRWMDFVFLFSAVSLWWIISFLSASNDCYAAYSSPPPGFPFLDPYPPVCHLFGGANYIGLGFFFFAFVKTILFLIADIRQKKIE